MKRIPVILLSFLLLFSLCACDQKTDTEDMVQTETLTVYTTFSPFYALTGAIIQDVPDINLHCLVQPQYGCLRSYELSDWDTALIASSANAMIAGGEGLESFIDTLESLADQGLGLAEVLHDQALFTFQGIEDLDDNSHFTGLNPHLYLSLKSVPALLRTINEAMCAFDPKYKALYNENLTTALAVTDNAIASISTLPEDSKVIVLHEALVYTALDCNATIERIVPRESLETASATEIIHVIEELKQCSSRVIVLEKQAPRDLIRQLQQAGFNVVCLDTLSACTSTLDLETYINILLSNANALSKAFA